MGQGQPGTVSFPEQLRCVPPWRCSASHTHEFRISSLTSIGSPSSLQTGPSAPWDIITISGLFSSGLLVFFRPHLRACGILVPPDQGWNPSPPALEAQSLNHWTAREFPIWPVLMKANIFSICVWLLLCWRGLEGTGQAVLWENERLITPPDPSIKHLSSRAPFTYIFFFFFF